MTNGKKPPTDLTSRIRGLTQAKPGAAPVKGSAHRRRAPRQDEFKNGVLTLPGGQRMQVVVKNLSDMGARVDFYAGASGIFGEVQLLVPSLSLDRRARVVWKNQSSAGLGLQSGLSS